MTYFEKALTITLQFEGGYSDNPRDPGGVTMRGVTQRVYDEWRVKHGLSQQSVELISDSELWDIYYSGYWTPIYGDTLAWPLSAAMFDYAVNSGPIQAIISLQQGAGVKADGWFGPITRAAIGRFNTDSLTQSLLHERLFFIKRLVAAKPNLAVFFDAWQTRIAKLQNILFP